VELEVDGERFRVVERSPRTVDLTWLTGPNPGYGFTIGGIPMDDLRLEDQIRGFLAEIDPATGYLADVPDLS